MGDIIKSFWRFIGEKVDLFLIVTYNISDDELRKGLEKILTDKCFEVQEDQSTYLGKILYQDFDNFQEELHKKIIQNDAITEEDFINLYSTTSKIKKYSIKQKKGPTFPRDK